MKGITDIGGVILECMNLRGDLEFWQEETMMRKLLTGMFFAAAAVAMIGFAETQPSEAANRPNPWCLKAAMGSGWVVDLCYFRTFAQCSQERFNYGPTSFCIHNPELYWTAKGERREPSPREFP